MKYENRVTKVLNELDWKIDDSEVCTAAVGNGDLIRIDYIVKIRRRKYAVDVKYSRNIDNVISTVFYRIVTQVRAYSTLKNKKMMAIFVVDSMSRGSVGKLKRQFMKYAPEFSWLAISNGGGYAYKLDNQIDVEYIKWKDVPEYIREKNNVPGLGFSDLELWMFKVLFFHNYKNNKGKYNVIKNAFQLSKIAKVARRTANNFVNNMISEGFIRQNTKYDHLHIINLEKYLDRWLGKYRIWDNQYDYYDYIQPIMKTTEMFSGQNVTVIGQSKKEGKYIYTGSGATDTYNVKFSTSNKIYIYSLQDNIEVMKKDLGLVPAEKESDIVVFRPKHHEAIIRALKYSVDKKVVDYIQLYLDCHSLPDRGVDQANEIKERLILNEG